MSIKYKFQFWLNGKRKKYDLLPSDIEAMEGKTGKELYAWYDTLNTWGWPAELWPNEENSGAFVPNSRTDKIMRELECRIGGKFAVLYHHNVHKGNMTEDEYLDWYVAGMGGNLSFYRDKLRSLKKHYGL